MVFKTAMLTSQSGVWWKFEVVVEKTTALQSFFPYSIKFTGVLLNNVYRSDW